MLSRSLRPFGVRTSSSDDLARVRTTFRVRRARTSASIDDEPATPSMILWCAWVRRFRPVRVGLSAGCQSPADLVPSNGSAVEVFIQRADEFLRAFAQFLVVLLTP